MPEQPTNELTRGVESRHRTVLGIEHLRSARVDAQPAEGKRDTAGHGEADVRRLIQRQRPVRLGRLDALGGDAVEAGWVVIAAAAGGVVRLDGRDESGRVDAEAIGELLDRAGLRLRHLSDAVLVAQAVDGLLVEELERDAVWLRQDLATVLRVGVVAEVRALVDEALASFVHDQAQRIGVLLVEVADASVARRRRVEVPGDRVCARPVAVRLCT